MKKAAIITLYGNDNYGNKLQNYAVQEILKKYNFEVTNLINIPLLNNRNVSKIEVMKFYVKSLIKKILYHINIHDCLNHRDSKKRQKSFLEFNQYINNTTKFFSFHNKKAFENYDYYFVGSDQIWNPNYGGLSDFDLLTFTDKQKIAFSASFGINEIPNQYHEKMKQALSSFKGISVREDSGKKIIENIIDRNDIEVLVDPTMMLSTEEWDKVSKKPSNLECNQYILCYFLGGISETRRSKIENFAKKKSYKIIDLLDKHGEYSSCGPSEFIYLESHASFICTDSFHATVFAILYHIPFLVFNREGKHNNMNSRIMTLLNKFNLNRQLFDDKKSSIEKYFDMDFVVSNECLNYERDKTNHFLEKCIK